MNRKKQTEGSHPMVNRIRHFLMTSALAAALALTGLPATHEAAATAASLSPEQVAAVQTLGSYFNTIRDIKGEFTQIGPKGHVSTGFFYISKPGRMRFEYAPPNPFIVVADGTWVTIKNNVKNKADQYPLSATPLRLVLAERVDLMQEADIKSVDLADGLTTVVLEDKDGLVPGQLVLVFDSEHNTLQQWVIVDGQGRRTTISLNNIEASTQPDPQLFAVQLPN
jgi:outer membrane lipoprotein-sorting protein